jgi:hypothetical protein
MRLLGFPGGLVKLLQHVYSNPRSKLFFQDVETEPMTMPIGLRQGCVLSPILFALYLSDLGRKLENSGLGVSVGNVRVPGMFFADDMILCGSENQLVQLLDIVSEFADQNKIEFNGPKSMVLAFGRNISRARNMWELGHIPVHGRNHERVQMSLGSVGKYLGVTYGTSRNIFSGHYEHMLTKAHRSSGVLGMLLRKVTYPISLINKLWSIYAVPAFMYGMEVIHFTNTQLTQLEVVQKGFIKKVLHLPRSTADAGIYLTCGVDKLETVVQRHKMNYYNYVVNCPDERWAFNAYLQQVRWCESDNILDDNKTILRTDFKGTHYWLLDVIRIMTAWNIDNVIPRPKNEVRLLAMRSQWDYFLHELDRHNSLRFIDGVISAQDGQYHKRWHRWWLKARLGAIFLNYKKPGDDNEVSRFCPVCMREVESLEHFITCDAYGTHLHDQNNFRFYTLQWWFSLDRTFGERSAISGFLGGRWSEREASIMPQ